MTSSRGIEALARQRTLARDFESRCALATSTLAAVKHRSPLAGHALSAKGASNSYRIAIHPLSLDSYTVAKGTLPGRGPVSLRCEDPTADRFWGPGYNGFGVVSARPVPGILPATHLLQDGFEFCSRLTMVDPETGAFADSHLPLQNEDLDVFEKDWGRIWSALQREGFGRESQASLLVGIPYYLDRGETEETHMARGALIAAIIESAGLPLTQVLPGYDGDQSFALDLRTGFQLAERANLQGSYANAQALWSDLIDRLRELSDGLIAGDLEDEWQSQTMLEVLEDVHSYIAMARVVDFEDLHGNDDLRIAQLPVLIGSLAALESEALTYLSERKLKALLALLAP